MNEPLFFYQTPAITIATNVFICRIPIRYRDTPILEFIREITTRQNEEVTTKIPVHHPDGTKLAVVKGNRIFKTEDGEKVGVELRYLPDGQVCEINGKPAFEIRRKGAAALKMDAELYTFDGAFLRWTKTDGSGLVCAEHGGLRVGGVTMQGCSFSGEVGIQVGDTAAEPRGAAVFINLPDPQS